MPLTDEQKELVQPLVLKRREIVIRNKLEGTFDKSPTYETDIKNQLEAAQIPELTSYRDIVEKLHYFTKYEPASVLITDGNELILAHPEKYDNYDNDGVYHLYSVSPEHRLSYLDIGTTELCMDLLAPIYRISPTGDMLTLTNSSIEEVTQQIFPKELFSKLAKRARLIQDLNLNT